jgi:hypothetical protein
VARPALTIEQPSSDVPRVVPKNIRDAKPSWRLSHSSNHAGWAADSWTKRYRSRSFVSVVPAPPCGG